MNIILTIDGKEKEENERRFGINKLDKTERQIIAREHFLKYCDSDKCIRGREFVISALNKGWHDGVCLECAFNPYNMKKTSQ